MLNYETLLSSYDDKLTLLQWLKKVEAALEDASAVDFKVNKKGDATLTFSIVFKDGSEIESGEIVLQQGESVESAAIVNGHLILTLTNGDELDAGQLLNGDLNVNGNLAVSGEIVGGSVKTDGYLMPINGAFDRDFTIADIAGTNGAFKFPFVHSRYSNGKINIVVTIRYDCTTSGDLDIINSFAHVVTPALSDEIMSKIIGFTSEAEPYFASALAFSGVVSSSGAIGNYENNSIPLVCVLRKQQHNVAFGLYNNPESFPNMTSRAVKSGRIYFWRFEFNIIL